MRRYPEWSYLTEVELDMLTRVLNLTSPEGTTELERSVRASTLVRLYLSGITKEPALVEELGGPAS